MWIHCMRCYVIPSHLSDTQYSPAVGGRAQSCLQQIWCHITPCCAVPLLYPCCTPAHLYAHILYNFVTSVCTFPL